MRPSGKMKEEPNERIHQRVNSREEKGTWIRISLSSRTADD